jgi:hypothetical protein
MVLIYTPRINARVTYITRYLFTSILGVPVNLTINAEEFKQYEGPQINYSNKTLPGINIQPDPILFEQNIRNFKPGVGQHNGIPVLFPTAQASALPFDPFAAAFFMITRYEEYLPHPTDRFGRFLAKNAIAWENGFLEIPVVDHWALALQQLIKTNYPAYPFPQRTYQYKSTMDVDIAYAYKYRSLFRTAGATIKSILDQRFDNNLRFQVLLNKQPDPYDTYSLFHSINQQYHINPVFFFQVGRYGRHDKNISASHPAMKKLIKEVASAYSIGIHPSYQSSENAHLLRDEIASLQNITNKPVTRSRQHYLKLSFPETYQRLIANGITEDYTMGYANLSGFRAGTCTPFPFYDLSTEKETTLVIYPFQIMDGTLNQYLKLSPMEAIDYISKINAEVRKVNGSFISLWHNTSLSETNEWDGWMDVFHALAKIAVAS